MASQDKQQTSQGPAGPDKKTEGAAEPEAKALEFSPTGLYIKDKKGNEMPLMHSIQEIVEIFNQGGSMSIYGITYGSIAALPSHIRGAINEVSGPGAATNTPDEIRARIAALQGELKERSAVLPA